MARMSVEYDDRKLRRNLRNFDSRLRRNIRAVVDHHAAETQVYLRTNARWTDRTGAARSGLFATAHHGQSFDEIFMEYSVTYGIWLEVANDRKYAIITPAIRIMGNALMLKLNHLIDRMENV
jgi:hypothetical protein